ncbi:MAG: NAD-dependent succinate-semialdehyde dehydrogenase [Bacteroidetes bacterium]|nr:MAG: NAD-dependent succinate-semialdehyde dehydrogenase [Bacteroidota bacterium]
MKSINPATNEIIQEYREHTPSEVVAIIGKTHEAWGRWKQSAFTSRRECMLKAAAVLRSRREELARLMTLEMGKIIGESLAEIEKCASGCDFYAEHAERFLRDEVISTDASRSFVAFQPLGVVLAVMPWNFPLWQVFRFAAPALMAGNAGLLKHASNVPGCALAVEEVLREAGFPEDLFRTLLIPSGFVETVIDHPFVVATTLTGSEFAGSQVASAAGRQIKKSLLELGGADSFIVLEDADLDLTVTNAVNARLVNQGQSCIAAKRFIVAKPVLGEFTTRIQAEFLKLQPGDPLDPATRIGPLARPDLVDDIDRQVHQSITMGAILIAGGKRIDRPGCYYEPTILTGVSKGMPAYEEETFGPLLAIIPVSSEEEAVMVANDSSFGLGGSVWTQDPVRGERIARAVETGAMFVNGITKSDPRLPFGGIKKSGYGRELGSYGIREFVNIKTVWIR